MLQKMGIALVVIVTILLILIATPFLALVIGFFGSILLPIVGAIAGIIFAFVAIGIAIGSKKN